MSLTIEDISKAKLERGATYVFFYKVDTPRVYLDQVWAALSDLELDFIMIPEKYFTVTVLDKPEVVEILEPINSG